MLPIAKKFSRTTKHRRSLVRNLVISLLKNGRITTTQAKADELRSVTEKIITKFAKTDKNLLTERRKLKSIFFNKNEELVNFCFEKVKPVCRNRPGGYLRLLKIPSKRFDAAPLSIIEFVDFENIYR